MNIKAFKVRVSHWIIPRSYLYIGSFGFRVVFFVISQPNDRFRAFYAPRMIDSVIGMLVYQVFALKFIFRPYVLFKKPSLLILFLSTVAI